MAAGERPFRYAQAEGAWWRGRNGWTAIGAIHALRVRTCSLAALAGLGGALTVAPQKVFANGGMPLAGEQAVLFARMLGLRDLALAYLLLKQPSARGRRAVLLAIVDVCAETAILAATAVRLSRAHGGAADRLDGARGARHHRARDLKRGCARRRRGRSPIAGYALIAPEVLEFASIVRQARLLPFAAFTAGATLAGAGWLFRRNPLAAIANFAIAAGGLGAWALARRKDAQAT